MWSNSYSFVLAVMLLSGCIKQPLQPSVEASEQVSVQLELGVAYLEKERLDLARQHLQKALNHATPEMAQWSRIHYALALIEMRTVNNRVAEYHFQQALDNHSRYPDAENGYGVLLCRQGRVAEAENHFLRAINDPQYATPEVAENNRKACGEGQR